MRLSSTLLISFAVLTAFTPMVTLKISSPDFAANGMIPMKFTCEGAGDSPALQVANVPQGTKSLALILHDPDAPVKDGFTHWVMWNLDIDGTIPQNFKGGVQGMNGKPETGYTGPCPPSGTHHYHFMVYALDTKLNITSTSGKEALEKAMQGHILAKGDLIGLYKKMK